MVVVRRGFAMWERSMQVKALRLLTAWWDSSHPTRGPWGRRRAGGDADVTADVLVLAPGYRAAHLEERLAEVG
jgi:hypothetical protein